MKKNNLRERLNRIIDDSGSEMGPALNNLILLGPIKKTLISDSNIRKLEKRNKTFEDFYYRNIFPKIGIMFEGFAGGSYGIPKDKNGLSCSFEYRNPEEIRERFKISYGIQQFRLDKFTKHGLFGDNVKLYRHGDNEIHCFNDNSGHILSSRYKSQHEIESKYETIYSKLSGLEKRKFLGFVVDIAENNFDSWSNYSYYKEKYDENSMEMLLGDIFGVKIVDLNQERARQKMKKLARNKGEISFGSFSSVKERFKDHRWRTPQLRPGGIHYTMIDSEFENYPVEIMFRGIRDEAYNLYGPNRHDKYCENGKKKNKTRFPSKK